MWLWAYLSFLEDAELVLGRSYELVSAGHLADADVHYATAGFARQCADHATALTTVRAGHDDTVDVERWPVPPAHPARTGALGLLRDLQDLHQSATLVDSTWSLVRQAAQGARDEALLGVADSCAPDVTAQLAWLRMRMRAAAPQTLLV